MHKGTYTDLSGEYYDAKKHPTCANFREASLVLSDHWLAALALPSSSVLEVGAGASIVADWISGGDRMVASLVATDISREMLTYSYRSHIAAKYIVCNAEILPFAAGSFDIVVSSLGDPYNTPQFWKEAARALRSGGYVLFTTPSHEWALKFRGETETAEFALSDGRVISVPSYVKASYEQRQLMEDNALTLIDSRAIEDAALRLTPRSPKLRPGPVVSGYLGMKR